MHYSLHSEIEIDAAPQAVWDVLTDLDKYEEWNPFVISAEGQIEIGEQLTNRLQPPGGKAMTFTPTVTEVSHAKSFEWLGHLGIPGIFDGRHRFELEATPNGGTLLMHSEQFKGILVRPLRKSLDGKTLQGFEAMNKALKARVEAHTMHKA